MFKEFKKKTLLFIPRFVIGICLFTVLISGCSESNNSTMEEIKSTDPRCANRVINDQYVTWHSQNC